jgi:hypothetical protein
MKKKSIAKQNIKPITMISVILVNINYELKSKLAKLYE